MGHLRANKKGGTLAPMKKHYVNLNHYDVFLFNFRCCVCWLRASLASLYAKLCFAL